MLVSDIWEDLIELTGNNSPATNFRALSLGLSWLANEKLFDPLIGYADFTVDFGHTIALPREVKTPLKININNNPSFHRSRLWEFSANTDGTLAEGVDGIGYTWDNRGYARVQDERPLPSKLRYVCDEPGDAGKTAVIKFYDADGRFQTATLTAAGDFAGAAETALLVHRVESVVRVASSGDCYLLASDERTVARYYGDEIRPEYRVIRLSQTGVAVRMMFRRHVPQVFSSQADLIPFHSRMAIIWAAKTVRLLQGELYDQAAVAANLAKEFAQKEQSARDEGEEVGAATEVAGARNANISSLEGLIVADLYDEAAEIFGPIGRQKLLDKMSMSRDLLARKGNWDSTMGVVNVWKTDTSDVVTPRKGMTGTGIFTLPRYVGSVINVRPEAVNSAPRNGWFEFHLNGTGERYVADHGNWEMIGTACVFKDFLRDPDTRKTIPAQIAAICLDASDAGKTVRVYGLERLEDGRELEVWRGGVEGYLLTLAETATAPAEDHPQWVEIRRVKKDATTGFTKLVTVTATTVTTTSPDPIEVELGQVVALPVDNIFYYNGSLTGNVPTVGDVIIYEDDMEATVTEEPLPLDFNLDQVIVTHDNDINPNVSTALRARIYTDFETVATVVAGSEFDPNTLILSEELPASVQVGDTIRLRNDGGFEGSPKAMVIMAINGLQVTMTTPPPIGFVDAAFQRKVTREVTETVTTVTTLETLGYYYPDETEPSYLRIKVHTSKECRITVRYRKRAGRISSLYEPLQLRSPLALIEAMRSVQAMKDDPQGAQVREALALRLLREHEKSDHPTSHVQMQFHGNLMPGGFTNIR